MDKLEKYLDQVCRSIGGPVEMRQHVRQELREHLLDAVAQHKAAGLPEDAAIDKAIEEFGKPDEVRTELEAAHGQRMNWIIDKALQWKEKTMKAKWLWMTWAILGLVTVILLEVLFITFNVLMIIPKFQVLMHHGMIDPSILEEHDVWWMPEFLNELKVITGRYTTWMLLGSIVVIALFEWRVKSENKPYIRLSALGTVAVGLMAVIILMSGSLVISVTLAMPAMSTMARPWAVEQVAAADTHLNGIELALKRKNWDEMRTEAHGASMALTRLSQGPAVSSLSRFHEPPTLHELRNQLSEAHGSLRELEQAIEGKDLARVELELAKTRKAFAPLREAAKRPPRK